MKFLLNKTFWEISAQYKLQKQIFLVVTMAFISQSKAALNFEITNRRLL